MGVKRPLNTQPQLRKSCPVSGGASPMGNSYKVAAVFRLLLYLRLDGGYSQVTPNVNVTN